MSAASTGDEITLTLPGGESYTIRDTPLGQVIEAPGFNTSGAPGEPLLPVVTLRLLVPPDIDWDSLALSVAGGHWAAVPGQFDLAPAPPVATDGPGGPVVDWGGKDPAVIREGRDTRAYARRDFSPDAPLSIVSRGAYRQWHIVAIEYRPFSYNPAEKRLRRLEGGVAKLRFGRRAGGVEPGTGLGRALPLQERFWQRLQPWLANAEAESLYYPQVAPSGTAEVAPGQAGNDYVIITTATIQQNSTGLAGFVLARQAAGHTVKVVVEGAAQDATHYLSGSNCDKRANNIRAWLASRYLAEGIDYVLLIGDPHPTSYNPASSVPMKMCYPNLGWPPYETSPTDMFYSDLTGNWNPDGDSYYGEYSEVGVAGGIDRLAEVNVGRIPFYGSYAELDGILAKLAAYGQATGDLSWRRKLLVAAAISNHGPQDNNGDGDATDPGDYLESHRTFGDTWGKALKSVAGANGYSAYSLYERQGVYSDGSAYPLTACDAGLTRGNLLSAWQGHYGFVDWWGHGYYSGACRRLWSSDTAGPHPGDHLTQHPAETQDVAFIDSADVPVLSDSYPSFVVQVSCLNGYPESSANLGYRLLEHGAVGTVSSSRVSWYYLGAWAPGPGEGSADNASFGYYIFSKMAAENRSVGQALASCRATLNLNTTSALWMNCTDFNLYGDPSLGLLSRSLPYRVHLPLCLRA
ncbi:MAG: C25 family cysteine peptidase [Anaerolineae bacterium]|nr:C25 family cysteine peptidase [Anaerolineae bacterium]